MLAEQEVLLLLLLLQVVIHVECHHRRRHISLVATSALFALFALFALIIQCRAANDTHVGERKGRFHTAHH